jgi:hypothetical protein
MEGIDTSLPLQRTGGSYITSPVNGRWAAGNARPWRFVDGLPPDDATGGYFYVKETYPADERQQQSAVHQRIRLSYLRLTLFMTIDALARTKQHRNLDPQQVMHLRAYLLRWGPAEQRAAIDAAAAQALALLAAARNVGN